MIGGLALEAAGAGLMARLPGDANVLVDLLPGFLLLGAGLGAVFVAATTTAMSGVAHDEAGLVSGLVNTGHELGSGLGVAVLSTVAAASLAGPAGAAAPVAGFEAAFTTMAVAAAVMAVGSLLALPAGRLPISEHPVFAH